MVNWLVGDVMDRRALPTGRPSLVDAAASLGLGAAWSPMSAEAELPFPDGSTVVLHGGKQGLATMRRRMGTRWRIVAFDDWAAHAPSATAAAFGASMLNDGFDALRWDEFVASAAVRWPAGVFVRPDDGAKTFAGAALDAAAVARLPTLPDGTDVAPETRVVVAPLRRILGESRFVAVDGEVVAGSTYRWAGKLDVRSDVPEASAAMAALVAAGGRGPARAFVCDVALVDGGSSVEPRIVEFNTLSSSGLYACDTRAVVAAVSRIAAETR